MHVFLDTEGNSHVCILDKHQWIRELSSRIVVQVSQARPDEWDLDSVKEYVIAHMKPGKKIVKNVGDTYWLTIKEEEQPKKK